MKTPLNVIPGLARNVLKGLTVTPKPAGATPGGRGIREVRKLEIAHDGRVALEGCQGCRQWDRARLGIQSAQGQQADSQSWKSRNVSSWNLLEAESWRKKVTSMDWFPSISHRSRPRKSSTARCFRPSALDPLKKIATVESGFLPSESLMKKPEGPEIQDDCPLIVEASCFAIHRSLQTVRSREEFHRTDIPRRRACVQMT